MTEEKKELYRELLRWAIIDMRMYSSQAFFGSWRLLASRRRSHREILYFINAMNDWLHNTALYSVTNFAGFKEELFWQDYQRFRRRFPADKWAGLTESVIEKLRVLA